MTLLDWILPWPDSATRIAAREAMSGKISAIYRLSGDGAHAEAIERLKNLRDWTKTIKDRKTRIAYVFWLDAADAAVADYYKASQLAARMPRP